jgi:hypothetical protein
MYCVCVFSSARSGVILTLDIPLLACLFFFFFFFFLSSHGLHEIATSTSSKSSTSGIKGRAVHIPGVHQWLATRPSNLAALVQALEREGVVVVARHGQPTHDYIHLQISWSFSKQDFSTYAWK